MRINRGTYWLGILLIIAVVLLVSGLTGTPSLTTGGLLALILLAPPRLRDFGLSGWYIVVPAAAFLAVMLFAEAVFDVPLLGGILLSDTVLLAGLAVIGAVPGRTAINRFGARQRPISRR